MAGLLKTLDELGYTGPIGRSASASAATPASTWPAPWPHGGECARRSEEQAAKCGFGTVSEYMRVLIRGVQERQAERECVDALLLAGLDSGPASPLTPVEWESIHQEVHKRHAARQERIHGSKDSEGCQASSGSSRYR